MPRCGMRHVGLMQEERGDHGNNVTTFHRRPQKVLSAVATATGLIKKPRCELGLPADLAEFFLDT